MKNILVTGSSGTIGTRLCERLLGAGYRVMGIDKVPNQWSHEIDAVTVIGDLCRPEATRCLSSSFDLVVHLAANARVHDLVRAPTLAFENVLSTFRVAEFCRASAIPRLIFASSREVYGNWADITRNEDEAQIDRCESPYAASKVSGEAMIRAYARCYGVRCVITRFSNVYGMYDTSDRLIPLFLKCAQKGQDLVIYGQHKMLDFTYIDDTVAGICACIRRFDSVADMTINIASGQGTRIADVAESIRRTTGSASKIVFRDNRTGEVYQFVADISLARKCLGYEPQVGIEEGLSRAIAWYLHKDDLHWLGSAICPGHESSPAELGQEVQDGRD
jgi:UDP-glucose 4-epimerase